MPMTPEEANSLPLLPKEELQQRIRDNLGVYPEQVTLESLREADLQDCVVLIPRDYKERIRFFGNALVQLCFGYKGREKNVSLKMELSCLATALSYLLNSFSFREDEYKSFDKVEVDRKLGRRAANGDLVDVGDTVKRKEEK